MAKSTTGKFLLNTFLLSVLLHLLFLLFFLQWAFQPVENAKEAHEYVPSYVYAGAVKPTHTKAETKNETPINSPQPSTLKSNESNLPEQSMLAATSQYFRRSQINSLQSYQEAEPIYMIGDDSHPADPLIKLLGRALSRYFTYPKTAGQLGIKGRAIIGMTLQLDGKLTEIQLISGSESEELDRAALYAVNNAPQIVGANRFISEPKRFVIGFIFQ